MVRYADDQLLLPGFVDSHQHFLSYVRSRESRLSLWQVVSFAQLRDTLQLAADRGDGTHWVIGVGYDQGRLHEQRHPTLAELDTMLPDIPAVIIRACSHIALVNSVALARAGVTATTA
ncbi:MAG: amidohydrolase family protein, partial [Roseiflexaceae bacterium]